MKEKNPIDELFKRRLGAEVTPFNEAHWEAMDALLSQQPKRRKGFWWWLGGLSLLLVVITAVGYEHFNENVEEPAVTGTQATKQVPNNEEAATLVSLEEGKGQVWSEKNELESTKDPSTAIEQKTPAYDEVLDNQESQVNGRSHPVFTGERGELKETASPASTQSNEVGTSNSGEELLQEDLKLNDPVTQGMSSPVVPSVKKPSSFTSLNGQLSNGNGGLLMNSIELRPHTLLKNEVNSFISGEKVAFPAFRPKRWSVTGFAAIGKYAAQEKQETAQDISLLSEYAEPTPLLSRTVGVDVSYSFNSWSLTSGIRHTSINEEVDFGVEEEVIVDYDYFEYQVIDSISDIVIEQIDSVYIEEEEFWQVDTTFIEVQDTTFSWVIDSLAITEGGGPLLEERPFSQQISFVEVPFMIGKTFRFRRLETTIRTGPSVGILTSVNGYYFQDDDIIKERREVTKAMVVNWHTELSLRYLLNANWSAGMLVGDRRAISPFIRNEGASVKYRGQYIGLSIGYVF